MMMKTMFRPFRTAAKWTLVASFLSVHAFGEDSAETIAELTAAYVELGGYIATYGSISEGKSVDATVGKDYASGIGLLRVAATKGEGKIEMRQWSTGDDRFYISANGKVMVVKGMSEQLASMQELSKIFTDKPFGGGPMHFAPSVLLSESVFSAGIAVGTKPNSMNFWRSNTKRCATLPRRAST